MLGRASGNGIEPGEEFMLDRLMQAYTYTYIISSIKNSIKYEKNFNFAPKWCYFHGI